MNKIGYEDGRFINPVENRLMNNLGYEDGKVINQAHDRLLRIKIKVSESAT